MDELFRKFFGLRPHTPHNFPDSFHYEQDHEPQEDVIFDGDNFFGSPNDGLDGMFEHFHRDMFQQMESLQRQMEDMMKGFGATEFPREFSPSPSEPNKSDQERPNSKIFIWSGHSPFFRQGPDSSKRSPRDYMLKDEKTEDAATNPHVPFRPKEEDKGFLVLPRIGSERPVKMEDTDLDGKISDKNLLEMIKRPGESSQMQPPLQPPANRPNHLFSSQSISVSTVTRPDGKTEQKRVVRDASGREESTVTRSIGDKSYTVTTITDESGSQEKHENLHNMDEGDLGKFEELWSKPRQEHPMSPRDSLLIPHRSPYHPVDPKDLSLFERLFGGGGR